MADAYGQTVDYFQQQLGLTSEQARGAARWMRDRESGLNPEAFNPAGGGQGAAGIGQWRGPRQRALTERYGPRPTFEQQLEFSRDELLGPESGALKALRGAKTEGDAYKAWGVSYERPGNPLYVEMNPRGGAAGGNAPARSSPEFPAFLLDSLLSGRPAEVEAPDPMAALDALLKPKGAAQESGAKPEAARAAEFIEPPGALPERRARPLEDLDQLSPSRDPAAALDQLLEGPKQEPSPEQKSFIEPPPSGGAPGIPAAGAPAAPAGVPEAPGPRPAAPPAGGQSLLNDLIQGAMQQMQAGAGAVDRGGEFARGVGEGVMLPGEDLRERLPNMPGAEQAGAAFGRVPGGMIVDPLRQAGQVTKQVMGGDLSGVAEQGVGLAMLGLGAAPRGAAGAGIGRGPGFRPRTPPTSATGKGIAEVRKFINGVFSPTTVDPFSLEAEELIRGTRGVARRETEVANAAIEPWRAQVNKYVPEAIRWMEARKAGTLPPGAPKPAILNFLDFVETRSTGAAYTGPPELRPFADLLRDLYTERRMAIEAEPTTSGASFIEDYYSHAWKEREKVRAEFGPRTGSGGNLRERDIPTISEGIDRGFTPVTFDPAEMTMRYIANMDRYLAHNEAFRLGRDSGSIAFHPQGAQPEGWVALQGRMAQTGHGGQAYAPAAFARVYNNSIASGVYADQLGGPIYNAILKTKNTLNSLVLGLSGYHAAAMTQEAVASGLARGIGAVTEGDMAAAAKQLGLSAMPNVPKAVRDTFSVGRKLQRQYLRIDDYGADYSKIADLLAAGGGRIMGRGQEWRGTAAENYFRTWSRGAAGLEAREAGKQIAANPLRVFPIAAREMARINDTLMSPLFDGMIPRLKAAAFFDEMKGFLDANPLATKSEQLAQSRRLIDTIDDRFGEMIMDNIFWGARWKQALQLATVSLGWELGSLRSALGAGADVARGQWSPRARYMIGLSTAIAIENAAYQYLKTGKGPEGVKDLIVPQTGGQTPEGAPERALLPGFEKDFLGWWHDPPTEFGGKLSPLVRLGKDLATGKDYFDHDIAPFARWTPDWFKAYGNHIMKSATPIPLKAEVLKGSNMPMAERVMGNRPAPEYLQNPGRIADIEHANRVKDLKGQLRGLYTHGRRTTEERKALDDKAKEIIKQLQREHAAWSRERKERKPLKHSSGAE